MPRLIDSPCWKHSGQSSCDVNVGHHTAGGLASALATLWGDAEVSINFCIAKNGDIYYGVRVGLAAWHCGRSVWNGMSYVNNKSVGVEFVNAGDGVDPFTQEQLDSYDWLIVHFIPQALGRPVLFNTRHRDISLEGKIDPSGNFPWHLYSDGYEQVRARVLSKPQLEVTMVDIETIPLILLPATHPQGHEVYQMLVDESLEDNWLLLGYPHYSRNTLGNPPTLDASTYLIDQNGKARPEMLHEKITLGADGKNFYVAMRVPEIVRQPGELTIAQVDYHKAGLGVPPCLRRIRVK